MTRQAGYHRTHLLIGGARTARAGVRSTGGAAQDCRMGISLLRFDWVRADYDDG